MPNLTVFLAPAAGSHAAPFATNESNADGSCAFHTMLSEQMSGGKSSRKPTSSKDTEPDHASKSREGSEEDKKAEATVQVMDSAPAPVAIPNSPITAAISASFVQTAAILTPGKSLASQDISGIGKGVPADAAAIDEGLTGLLDLRAGVSYGTRSQPASETQLRQSPMATLVELGAEFNAVQATSDGLPPLVATTMLASNGTPAPATPPALTLHTPIGTPGWAGELAGQITYLLGAKMQSAELHLNPAHLGPMEVRIQIGADQQTSIAFAATHIDTRVALENALPRLREMLADSGISVANCSVSPESFAQNSAYGSRDRHHAGTRQEASANSDSATPVTRTLRRNGLVDTFA